MPASESTSTVAELTDEKQGPSTSDALECALRNRFEAVIAVARGAHTGRTFLGFEDLLVPLVFELGRLLIGLFLAAREEDLAVPTATRVGNRAFRRRQSQSRLLGTRFGKVRYWRTYMHSAGAGYYPLDRQLALPGDGFSLTVTSLAAQVATKMSYAQTCLLLRTFLGWSPSQTTVEHAVLGLGKRTAAWFEQCPAPEDDGDVLIIMIDSKATPTATEGELEKRRGKRRQLPAPSPRHRSRLRRKGWTDKPRRKKGDKSKNGRAATLVVMYTLKTEHGPDGKVIRKGPINRRVYASYAKKRHAFAIARREANQRGFKRGSGKLVQVVIDGELSFAEYVKEYFPEAIITLDVIHATEYLWQAGRSLYREGSKELAEWVDGQKTLLYSGKIEMIIHELDGILAGLPKTGPGNKGRRQRLRAAAEYLRKRTGMMAYDRLIADDLEISSGPVEGAVRYVIAQRFDAAGMRWIRERCEALLQLRCIEVNGDWDAFIRFVEAGRSPPGRAWFVNANRPGGLPSFVAREAA